MAMIRTIQSIVPLALVVLGLLLNPMRVSAHADYERSEPARNAVLRDAPAQVDVWFTQEVFKREGANFVRVFDEQEVQVSEGDGIVDDDDRHHISTTLPPDLTDGRYIVRWMTTSDEDGDTDDGAFCFYVAVDPTAEQEAECAAFGDGEDDGTIIAPFATATEPEAPATPTGAPVATPTAGPPGDDTTADDDGGVPTAVVVGAIAGAAVLIVIVGAVAVWLRRNASVG